MDTNNEDDAVSPRPRGRPRNADRVTDHVTASELRDPEHEADHGSPRVRRRNRNSTINPDMFYFPVEDIPEGSSYEWKRYSNMGEENPYYIAQMREQGLEPVLASRHPTYVPPGYKDPHIIKYGMILMERPIELTQEARAEQRQLARTQVREAEQRLGMTPKDTGTRDMEGVRPRVVREVGRMVATEESPDG